jgi:DNA-binding PadR family transcriptional regulator
MSTIFGHGRLRLYLLKLLDESPKHGYEIISLLRDRFLGVYSPSPGTIYPRLARLEEEGLVTHTEEGGRKVYSLTDKGREELRARESDLDDLEREITDSVRDIARAVKQDVRATISSLRDELKFASGTARGSNSERGGAKDSESSEEDKREKRERWDDSGMWAREWERFAQGFGAFGAAWGNRTGSDRDTGGDSEREGGDRPDFEHALRDFSAKVRDMVRGAGQVGESATHDLRRILDDTVEVIRRDLGHWGPPDRGPEDSGAKESPSDGSGSGKPEAEPDDEGTGPEGSGARPMPPSGGDPWSTATGEDDQKDDEKKD